MNERFIPPIRKLIDCLVLKQFDDLEVLTCGKRLTAQEISTALSAYGRTLVFPPDEAFELMNVVEVRSARPRRWSVSMPLWTREEGRSDLSIEVTLIDDGQGYKVELDDVRVL